MAWRCGYLQRSKSRNFSRSCFSNEESTKTRRGSSLRGHHRTLTGRIASILSPSGARRDFYAAGRRWSFCYGVAGHQVASCSSDRARMFRNWDKTRWLAILAMRISRTLSPTSGQGLRKHDARRYGGFCIQAALDVNFGIRPFCAACGHRSAAAYLDECGRSSYNRPVAMYAFVSRKYEGSGDQKKLIGANIFRSGWFAISHSTHCVATPQVPV